MAHIKIFELLDLNLLELRKIECVCRHWRRGVIVLLSSFRELQYTFPQYEFTQREKKMLLLNKDILSGHSKWLTKLLKIDSACWETVIPEIVACQSIWI